jgi:hypothetical protein
VLHVVTERAGVSRSAAHVRSGCPTPWESRTGLGDPRSRRHGFPDRPAAWIRTIFAIEQHEQQHFIVMELPELG